MPPTPTTALLALTLLLPLASCQTAPTSVWSYYTRMPGSFLLAGDLLSNGATTTMDEECAAACLQLGTDKCQAWSWCGAFFTDGCEVLNYSNATGDATSALLPPGACLLSGGEATDQLSTSSMFGDSLMWSSGYYDPSLAAGTAQGASQTPPSAASTHDSAAPIWARWAYIAGTLHVGPNIVGAATALTPEECAEMCEATPPCKWWAHCRADAAGCAMPLFRGTGVEDATFEQLANGTCVLSHGAQDGGPAGGTILGRMAYRYQEGSAVAWSSGYLNASASPAPTPPTGGGDASVPSGGSGTCSIPGWTDCGGGTGCRDLTIDGENCGACGNRCGFGETCNFGSCDIRCGPDPNRQYCGTGGCVDLTSDAMHCGVCAFACMGGQQCVYGRCQDGFF